MRKYVKKRDVFYLAGYDPRGARHYYNLYKRELNRHCMINGMDIEISKRFSCKQHEKCWKIYNKTNNDIETTTTFHFLEWDDIIRENWKKNILELYIDLFHAMRVYLFSGLIFKYAKSAPRQMVTAFYPVAYLLITLFLSLYLYIEFTEKISILNIPSVLIYILSLLIPIFVLKIAYRLGNKLAVFWLLRIYIFSSYYSEEKEKKLNERLKLFSNYISNAISTMKEREVDELVIISHSVGTIINIPILADALKDIEDFDREKIAIVNLGECIPLVSFQKNADFYRDMMLAIAKKRIFWIDYTTPIDGACFPLLDFYKHSGLYLKKDEAPHYLSPRFHTLFSKETYAKIRKNKYAAHFVYLMATELPGRYNFFNITAGSTYLRDSLKDLN